MRSYGLALLAPALVLALAPVSAWAQSDCSSLSPGDYTCEITTADGLRNFLVHVPAQVTPASPVPLVIDMHGYTSNATVQRIISGWWSKSNTEGFIVAWPNGLGNAWNSQGLCCSAGTQDDVAFIETVVANIRAAANIDPKRIYATGLSNGGSQTHTMACESAHLFTGAAAVSFGLSGGANVSEIIANCTPSRGIPVIHFHGTADATVPYATGVLDSLGAQASLAAWSEIQSCDPAVTSEQISPNTLCETHSNCIDGKQVTLCSTTGGTHVLYNQLLTVTIVNEAWDFFESFPVPVPLLSPAWSSALVAALGLVALYRGRRALSTR